MGAAPVYPCAIYCNNVETWPNMLLDENQKHEGHVISSNFGIWVMSFQTAMDFVFEKSDFSKKMIDVICQLPDPASL